MLSMLKRCYDYFENENHSIIMVFYFLVSPIMYSVYFRYGLIKHFEIIGLWVFLFVNAVTVFGWFCYVKVTLTRPGGWTRAPSPRKTSSSTRRSTRPTTTSSFSSGTASARPAKSRSKY